MLFHIYQNEVMSEESKKSLKIMEGYLLQDKANTVGYASISKTEFKPFNSIELNVVNIDSVNNDKWIFFIYSFSTDQLFECHRESKIQNYILEKTWKLKDFMDSDYYKQFSQLYSWFDKIETEIDTTPKVQTFHPDHYIQRFCKNFMNEYFQVEDNKEIRTIMEDYIIKTGNNYLRALHDNTYFQQLVNESKYPYCDCAKCHYDERPEDFEDDEFADIANECHCECNISDRGVLEEIVLDRLIQIENLVEKINKVLQKKHHFTITILQEMSELEIGPFIEKYIKNRIVV